MLLFLMLTVLLTGLSAGSAVLLPDYPDDFDSVEEIRKTAEMYYKAEEEKGNRVRYISDIRDLKYSDTTLYIVAHGNTNGIIYIDREKGNTSQLLSWYSLLTKVKQTRIKNLVLDTCNAGSVYSVADKIEFKKSIRIYVSCDEEEMTGAPKGEATYFSVCWRYDEDFEPEYKYYKGTSFFSDSSILADAKP